jgi:hypothetical protein
MLQQVRLTVQCVILKHNYIENLTRWLTDYVWFQEQVGRMKHNYDLNLLLKPLPSEFKHFSDHIAKLKYEDKPDYKVTIIIQCVIERVDVGCYSCE